MLKGILSKQISHQQFAFLKGRQIYGAVGVAQEGLYSIKLTKLRIMVVKVDHLKAYDRFSWLYLRFMLIHLGFCAQIVSWVINLIT